MKTRFLTIISIIVLFTIISCKKENTDNPTNNSKSITVKVNTIGIENTPTFIKVSGKIEAVNSAILSTRLSGFVDKISVKVGDKVSKGQLLLSINNADLLAKLAQASANVTEANAAYYNAEKDYGRFTNLFANQSASQKELDDITTSYNMAKARLEAAKQMKNEVQTQFGYVNIRSPFDGVISNKFINIGDMAKPGEPLLQVESPDKFQVIAKVPEFEIPKIEKNALVSVNIAAINSNVQGTVVEISSSANNTGGQYLVKAVLEATEAKLMSGMFATVQFPRSENETSKIILIPKTALVAKGSLSGVYTVSQSNTAMLRWLRLGRDYGENVEVLSGLDVDDSYIISAEGRLFNGVKITIQ